MPRKVLTEPKFPDNVVLTLRVTIRGIEPFIWRRIEVPASITLSKLHMVLQDSFGWTNSHLHSFLIRDTEYGYEDELGELDITPEKGIRLYKTLKINTPGFWYIYDFGDHWLHDVQIETWTPPRQGRTYPICLAGERKCPPEDCGSTHGYQRILEVLGNPDDEEFDELMNWLGDKYDPEEFDLRSINRRLQKYSKTQSSPSIS